MFRIIFFVFALFSTSISNAEIITDDTGNKYITIGSSKDEVLEVLGTPSSVISPSRWGYDGHYIDFDTSGKIFGYSGAHQLKIRLLPKNKPQNDTKIIPKDDSFQVNSTCTSPNSRFKSSNSIYSSTNSSASGYGEISSTTGRAKTVHVRGYTKKDGTYVRPYYRSPPRKK
jgi:outer membrane protein assembly factor BamE (lipoprotein component of BamABCDE complex)